jgi:hypothetical protein
MGTVGIRSPGCIPRRALPRVTVRPRAGITDRGPVPDALAPGTPAPHHVPPGSCCRAHATYLGE